MYQAFTKTVVGVVVLTLCFATCINHSAENFLAMQDQIIVEVAKQLGQLWADLAKHIGTSLILNR